MLDIAFFLKDLFSPITKSFDIGLFDVVALFELIDPLVKIVV